MFTPEQVKPFLLHPDALVSNGAIQYFAESYQYTDGIMELVLDKLRRTENPGSVYLHWAIHFPQSSQTVAEIVKLLLSDDLKDMQKDLLSQILLSSSPRLLEQVSSELEHLPEEIRTKAQVHMGIASLSAEELTAAFEQMLEASRGLDYGDLEYDYLDYLITQMVQTGALAELQVIGKLKDHNREDLEDYTTAYYAQAAGRMKLESAVPLLIEFLTSENDLLVEQSLDALVRIGGDEVIARLTSRYEQEADDYFKLYAAEALGRMSASSAESSLLQLLQKERNLTHATKLASGLCRLGSAQSVPVVAKMIEMGFDDEYLDLREALYINCIMNQVEIPELSRWRKEIEHKDARRHV
ncbi:hypothetical protein DCC85_06990 [Paenibacillus sp. CAA11]|uniref:HEAT repeat domain-containing protein n=1 Tax=Paenibacillus sp. CAA11 TaxID=1532905 RepID=UPI000D3364AC|nr:HEAT repeat domain-containing protein [Paenibacillus sp. CAA11]AWB43992.1 hypothetical protein DCC85_06990 [Paenibacillus sp. CAA11]